VKVALSLTLRLLWLVILLANRSTVGSCPPYRGLTTHGAAGAKPAAMTSWLLWPQPTVGAAFSSRGPSPSVWGGNPSFVVKVATAVLYAVADLPLVSAPPLAKAMARRTFCTSVRRHTHGESRVPCFGGQNAATPETSCLRSSRASCLDQGFPQPDLGEFEGKIVRSNRGRYPAASLRDLFWE
jgi:hypothetical protein